VNIKTLLALCGLMIPTMSQSATEFEGSIPVELVKIFLNAPMIGNVMIYTDLPDNFPIFEMPDDFTILGSIDQGFMGRAVMETDLETEEASTLLFNSLLAEGWQDMTVELPAQQTGFVSRNLSVVGLGMSLCHDDLGSLLVQAVSGEGNSIVSLIRSGSVSQGMVNMQSNFTCEQQRAMQQGGGPFSRMDINEGVRKYMPRMEMPELPGVTGFPGLYGGGGGGSMNDWEMRSNLPVDWELAEVLGYFSEQINEQGWDVDTSWSGDIAAGGVWTKTGDEDMELYGMLSIVQIADENFELKFRLFTTGQPANGFFTGGTIRGINISQ
jgi:hypothetical protein